jgi:hypothetical protein
VIRGEIIEYPVLSFTRFIEPTNSGKLQAVIMVSVSRWQKPLLRHTPEKSALVIFQRGAENQN